MNPVTRGHSSWWGMTIGFLIVGLSTPVPVVATHSLWKMSTDEHGYTRMKLGTAILCLLLLIARSLLFSGSSRISGRTIDVCGLERGLDRQVPWARIQKPKAPRGDTEEGRGSRRKDKNRRTIPNPLPHPSFCLRSRPRFSAASSLSFFAAIYRAMGPGRTPSRRCVKGLFSAELSRKPSLILRHSGGKPQASIRCSTS